MRALLITHRAAPRGLSFRPFYYFVIITYFFPPTFIITMYFLPPPYTKTTLRSCREINCIIIILYYVMVETLAFGRRVIRDLFAHALSAGTDAAVDQTAAAAALH